MLLRPKPASPRPEVKRYATAQEALQSIQARSAAKIAKREEEASSAPVLSYTVQTMQTVLDRLAKAASVPYRLVCTTREFGLLKRRLRENPPDDFESFLTWSLVHWPLLAAQNEKANRTSIRTSQTTKRSLPPAVHFQTWVYWYPYFLKAYRNHLAKIELAGKEKVVVEDRTAQELRVAKAALAKAAEVNKSLKKALESARAVPPKPVSSGVKTVRPRPRPSTTPGALPLSSDLPSADLPDWEQ